jgi:hypothetical protein
MTHFEQPGAIVDGDPATTMRFPSAGRRPRAHWAEMRFPRPRRVNQCDLLWSREAVRPALFYLDGQDWKPVTLTAAQTPGTTSFETVETTALRVEFEAPAPAGASLAGWRIR